MSRNNLRFFGHRIVCPECESGFKSIYSKSYREGCTMDCPKCGALLIFLDGETLSFHRHMNSKYSDWPEDGEGTGHVDI